MGIEIPKIEVRYEHLSVEGDVYVGSRALPTLLNATLNTIEVSFRPFIFFSPFLKALILCYGIFYFLFFYYFLLDSPSNQVKMITAF